MRLRVRERERTELRSGRGTCQATWLYINWRNVSHPSSVVPLYETVPQTEREGGRRERERRCIHVVVLQYVGVQVKVVASWRWSSSSRVVGVVCEDQVGCACDPNSGMGKLSVMHAAWGRVAGSVPGGLHRDQPLTRKHGGWEQAVLFTFQLY